MVVSATLHPVVVELLAELSVREGVLVMPSASYERWIARFRDASPASRAPIAIDLATVAARFRREAPNATEWAVHALMFLAIELAGSIERAQKIFGARGLELDAVSSKYVAPVESIKAAPKLEQGRTRTLSPTLAHTATKRLR